MDVADSRPARLEFVRDGRCEAVVVSEILVMFHLRDSYDEGLLAAFNRSVDVVRPHARFFTTHNVVRARRISDHAFDSVSAWLEDPVDERGTMKLELFSGETERDVGDYSLRVYLPGNNPEFEAGYLQLAMPMSVGLSDPSSLRALTLDIVRTLPSVWAQSGFAIEYDIMRVIPDRDRQMAAWAARYLCLNHRDPDRLAECARNCLGGLGWLTIVSTALVDAADDDDLKAEIEREASARGTEGYVFQAGDRPILGDSNRNEDPAEYRRVHRVLRDLYCDNCPPPPGVDDDPAWVRSQRFD